jgi:Mlc titration factor MtfA (ptsG expression regulator)
VRAQVLKVLAQIVPVSEHRDRVRWREGPFPSDWRTFLLRNVPHYAELDSANRDELERQVLVFVNEKRFEGCAGFEITDEVRVTIAGQACLLSLGRDLDFYPKLRVLLVYPDSFVAQYARFTSPQPRHDDHDPRLGESWQDGVVVLSWSGVRAGSAYPGEFRNVVAHEFAHQLDQEDGAADGIPLVDGAHTYRVWARLVADEFAQHVARLEGGEETVLDAYGATNPAEFFAVAVEAFFERPRDFRADRPALYELLREYFNQNPAGR